MELKNIILTKEIPIAVIQLNRPDALNVLSHELMTKLAACFERLDSDDSINCIVITGNEKAFAAGTDIMEMGDADANESRYGKGDNSSLITTN